MFRKIATFFQVIIFLNLNKNIILNFLTIKTEINKLEEKDPDIKTHNNYVHVLKFKKKLENFVINF